MNIDEIVLDRSPAQKAIFANKCRDELKPLGYSVVTTEWLAQAMMDLAKLDLKKRREVA